jgi:hypothetical protein
VFQIICIKKNNTPPAEYFATLKSKYAAEFDKISESLNNFTDEEIYMFINYIFEYTTTDTYDTQYMLIPDTRTKTVLFGLNLFTDIYELKKKHRQNNELPLLESVEHKGAIKMKPGPAVLNIRLRGVSEDYEITTNQYGYLKCDA